MKRLASAVVAVLVFGSVVAGGTGAGAAGSAGVEPSVDVTVAGSPIADGGRHETASDVEIEVSAAARDNETTLDEIVVRIDGERRESWTVNGTTATRSARPDLGSGNNTARVIVTDDAGNVNSTQFTIYQDKQAPHIYLTSPYDTVPGHSIPDGSANRSKATLSGNVLEDSTVERVIVTHSYGSNYENVTTLRNVGEDFSVPLVLGYTGFDSKTNRVRISVIDEFGNSRSYEFTISVTDSRAPNIELRPFPNETTRNRVFFAGRIRDDIWVDQAAVTVEQIDGNVTDTDRVVNGRDYEIDLDRLSKSFNQSLYLNYPGTYEVTINATDITGASASKTLTIERQSRTGDRTPTVTVDRDRTVVIDAETLFLSGSAFEGITERLVVETRTADTGETLDYGVVHSGDGQRRVDFDREVAIDGRTEVIVRATGPKGDEVATRFFVNGTRRETFVGNETGSDDGPSWPRATVTHLQDGRAGTASSSVTIRRASAGTTVALPPVGGPDVVASTSNVSLTGTDLSFASAANVTGTVVVRERADGALRAPPDARTAATVSVQHSLPADSVSSAALSVRVNSAYLDAHGFDPENLTAYRPSGGNWSTVETTLVGRRNGTVRYRVESAGLSAFSLAALRSPLGPDADGNRTDAPNVTDPATGNETTPGNRSTGGGTAANETTPTDRATGNETASGDSGDSEPTPEAQIFVSNVTVNRTQVPVDEAVLVDVTLANSGDAGGTYVVGVYGAQEPDNRTLIAEKEVMVPAGAERTVNVTARFAEPGNHTVSANGTQTGPVVVSGGGLLSVFSFVPVRLIGVGLGVLVGLGVVLLLVRFVLRRVGGGGEEAGG